MDWKSINFDWNRARAFYAAAEKKSFSAAAESLNVTQSTLGRQVAALEQELGVILFERIGKGVEITPSGLELFDCVKEMAAAANKLSLVASGKSMELSGKVAITSTEAAAAYILPSFIEQMRQDQPSITIEIVASNKSKDLRRREADIAIRNHPTTHADLIEKKIKTTNAYIYAHTNFIKKYGPTFKYDALEGIPFVGVPNNSRWVEALNELGLKVDDSNFPITTENHLVHWSIVKQGIAIGVMPEIAALKEQNIVRVFPDLPSLPIDTWVVTHRELKTSRKIRFVFDNLVKYLNDLQTTLDNMQ